MSTQGDVLASPAQREPRTSMSVQLFTVEDELKSSPDTTLGKLKATFGSCELAGTAGMGAGRLAERLSLYGIVPKGATSLRSVVTSLSRSSKSFRRFCVTFQACSE